ncbi:MAG TPA: GTP-binding protein [Gordonia sp. (in: high G+C Gram-positive bacteria)]|uniref:CobW family GTP-binding protein n=1 Tax=unclassified Gordonia (in: high G+C Gram-positive bacteria) TaxID=2657482 RepID=UPI000FB2EA4D|nr:MULTISPECIES: GTP-binding protein [unclassified Gordonia (in: high G+C Gram-positive bacteria)]RUP41076.1 MAG: GTP-binding protein [Gordonia sp. (in: high G+C Gram-positive bacteria)]HNP57962.1 GTP-binding protein [Gordonia sp. (in: high G+C Gram-positive bacteria)]HRC49710.1 GTP-binding protein [Gordonia sp. (in: high G+C Gram-positive bacteria)]
MSKRAAVPVIVLGGALGAGKTTVLNHVLRHAGELRLGVIVNDFGAVNVDALMVAGQVDGVVGFGNGCLCCATDSDGFADAVARLVRTEVDAVLVEASGIADPRSMIRRVAAIDDRLVSYGGLVYVVDADAVGLDVPGGGDLPRGVQRDAGVADLLVVNKADLVDAAALDSVGALLDRVNPTAPRLVTSEGVLDPGLLVDARRRAARERPEQLTLDSLLRTEEAHEHAGHDHTGHEDYQQFTWEHDGPVNPRAMARLLERPPAGCYRIKGWVRVDSAYYSGQLDFSAVGGRIRATRSSARRSEAVAATVVVLIGIGMDLDLVQVACAAVSVTDPDDGFGALSLLRYDPQTANTSPVDG